MRRGSVTLSLLCAFCLSAFAQQTQNSIPFFRFGAFEGRPGVAIGPTFYTEVNPASWMGAYALVGDSKISGYKTQGVDAHAKDLSAGMGFVVRAPQIKRMRFGGFFQTQYADTDVGASFPNGSGGIATYRQSSHACLMSAGMHFEVRTVHGVSLVIRPGRDFIGGLAASQGGGFYFAAGLVVNPFSFISKKKF